MKAGAVPVDKTLDGARGCGGLEQLQQARPDPEGPYPDALSGERFIVAIGGEADKTVRSTGLLEALYSNTEVVKGQT